MRALLPKNWHRFRDAHRQRWSLGEYRRRFGGAPGTGLIGYTCFAGLANRMQAHVAALALSRRSGLPVVPLWPRNSQCGAVFEDLFQTIPPSAPPRFEKAVLIPATDDAPESVSLIPGRLNLLDYRWQYQDIFWAERHGLRDWVLEQLRFTPAVIDRLAPPRRREGFRIGVHIRRGDFVTHSKQAQPTDAYVARVRELIDDRTVQIYLATDGGADVRAEIRNALPGHEVTWSDLSSVRESADAIRDAWRDVMELADCDALVLTRHSSFGRLARFFSRRPQQVVVVG